MLFDSIKSQNC